MLAGESNSGKTQTLNGVYDCLVQSSEIVQKKLSWAEMKMILNVS